MIDLSAFTILSGFSDLTITTGENGVTIDLIAHGGGTTSELGRDASWRTGGARVGETAADGVRSG